MCTIQGAQLTASLARPEISTFTFQKKIYLSYETVLLIQDKWTTHPVIFIVAICAGFSLDRRLLLCCYGKQRESRLGFPA